MDNNTSLLLLTVLLVVAALSAIAAMFLIYFFWKSAEEFKTKYDSTLIRESRTLSKVTYAQAWRTIVERKGYVVYTTPSDKREQDAELDRAVNQLVIEQYQEAHAEFYGEINPTVYSSQRGA